MKTKLTLVAFSIFMLSSSNVEAQFLKKLKNKVEESVEEAVINKTAEKAVEKASKSMDQVFDMNFGKGKQSIKVIPEHVPETFTFAYKYQLQVTSSQGKMTMDYLLQPGASYLGVSMDVDPDMFMVMDGEQNINYLFLEANGSKICSATSFEDSDEYDDEMNELDSYTITALPNKTFLDYDCPGLQIENDDVKIIMYYTNEAAVSYSDVFTTNPDRIPKALRSHFKENQNSLMMYMDMKDKKNKGKKNISGTMECTSLETTDFQLSTVGYKLI